MSYRVRGHERQLPSGKTTSVRQHTREGGDADRQAWADRVAGTRQGDDWWDRPGDDLPPPAAADDPPGTWYFRQDDQVMAVHPDGTVHAAEQDEKEEPVSEEPPEGTWYVAQGDDIYVWPDGSSHLVPQDKPEPEPERGLDEGIHAPRPKGRCPSCGAGFPINVGGNLAGHRDPDDPDDPSRYCPGSGTQMRGRAQDC